MKPLCIAIDARLSGGGRYGGTEAVVLSLARGLSRLTDGEEECLLLTARGADQRLRPYVRGPCRILDGLFAGELVARSGRGEAALLFDPDDAEPMAEAIRRL